jgi:phosphoribosylpyrophosphate synthetase
MPYFSYAKGDKKDEPRVSIRARVCADAIEVAGADRVITLDLHAPQIQGFFRIPLDDHCRLSPDLPVPPGGSEACYSVEITALVPAA